MKTMAIASIFVAVLASFSSFSSSQVAVCTYGTGAEVVVDLSKENKLSVDVVRTSPQGNLTQKIHIENQKHFSETADYVEKEMNGKKIIYALKCKIY